MVLAMVIFLAIISISTIVSQYVDLLWFREVGFQQVFWKILICQV